MELRTNQHSVFRLNYHLIMCIKYRKQVLNDEISKYLLDIFTRIGKLYNIDPIEWEHDKDHIHCLFESHPNSELSKFINAYKSASSRLVKKQIQRLKTIYGKNLFGHSLFV
jgi:putative transposase